KQLAPADYEIFKHPLTTAEHYINNMRYLDNCLRDYITALGGDTTVMIYADHPTENFDGFPCDRNAARSLEYIPCFIYDSEQPLSQLQKTRSDPRASDGTWNLADVTNYLRGQIKRSRGTAQPEAPQQQEPPNASEAEK